MINLTKLRETLDRIEGRVPGLQITLTKQDIEVEMHSSSHDPVSDGNTYSIVRDRYKLEIRYDDSWSYSYLILPDDLSELELSSIVLNGIVGTIALISGYHFKCSKKEFYKTLREELFTHDHN